ncbi:MAG: hypothetical protein K9N55_19545 [Phycisphaerae bacterium]|nr:hypothetical protein [Phycisphaerae bacterium]
MAAKVKTLSRLVLVGLLLGVLPVAWLYGADSDRVDPSRQEKFTMASIQFILVQIERETLDQFLAESNALTLDSIPLEKIARAVRDKDGANIVSQTMLTAVSGVDAGITVVENAKRQEKNPEKAQTEHAFREMEISIKIKIERSDGNRLAARFTYTRGVTENAFNMREEAEEEEDTEQKFEVSSGIVLESRQMHLTGLNMNDDMATLLLMKAEL